MGNDFLARKAARRLQSRQRPARGQHDQAPVRHRPDRRPASAAAVSAEVKRMLSIAITEAWAAQIMGVRLCDLAVLTAFRTPKLKPTAHCGTRLHACTPGTGCLLSILQCATRRVKALRGWRNAPRFAHQSDGQDQKRASWWQKPSRRSTSLFLRDGGQLCICCDQATRARQAGRIGRRRPLREPQQFSPSLHFGGTTCSPSWSTPNQPGRTTARRVQGWGHQAQWPTSRREA